MGKKVKRAPQAEVLPASSKLNIWHASACGTALLVLAIALVLQSTRQSHNPESVVPAFQVRHPELIGNSRNVAIAQSDSRCCATSAQVLDEPDGTPIVVVAENFLCKPELMIDEARKAKWERKTPGEKAYPGSQAWLNKRLSNVTHSCMLPLIEAAFGKDAASEMESAPRDDLDMFFGLIWFPESQLNEIQKLAHIDVSEVMHRSSGYACVTSLAKEFGNNGGVGLYRQHGTNISLVTDRGVESNRLTHIFHKQLPSGVSVDDEMPGYSSTPGNSMFDEIAVANLKFNRAILYDIRRQHKSSIPDTQPLTDDPSTGRLTLNGFVYRKTSAHCNSRKTCNECIPNFGCAWCLNLGECMVDVAGSCGPRKDRALVGKTTMNFACP